jgi:hypothetical protein
MMHESSAMVSLCPIFLEGPTKMAMQHAEDESLLAHVLRNEPVWQDARLLRVDYLVGRVSNLPVAVDSHDELLVKK